MTQPAGRTLPLSPARRFMCDLLTDARRVPTAWVQRPLQLADVAAARQALKPRPSWCALFTRAFALVSAARPELRRAYLDWPWPHFHERSEIVAVVASARLLGSEAIVCRAHLRQPQNRGLMELEDMLRRQNEAPVESGGILQRTLERVLRLFLGRSRRQLGTFGVTSVANRGLLNILTPLPTLTYGKVGAAGVVDVRLTFDYRVLNGATAAQVLDDLECVLNGDILTELRRQSEP